MKRIVGCLLERCSTVCSHPLDLQILAYGSAMHAMSNNLTLLLNLIITIGLMLLNHSPDKQNRSPEGKRRQKTAKEVKTPHELLQVLALNHIMISPQLATSILQHQDHHDHHQKEIKLFGCKPDDEVQQLKVKLADYEFQLKKIGEDFAEFQLLTKMDKDKSIKRLREELDFEKHRNREDNSKWEKKFAQRNEQYQKQCEAYKMKINQEYKKANEQNISALHVKNDETISKLNKSHGDIVRHLQRTMEELKLDFEQRLKMEKENHHTELHNLRKIHEAVLKEKQEVFETKIIEVQSEKKAQIRAIEQTKKESCKIQQKYLYQIGLIERQKRRLQEKADQMEMKCKILSKRLQDRVKQIQQLQSTHAEQLQKVQSQRSNAVENARALISRQKAQFLRDEYARTEQIQLKLIKLNEVKEQMQVTYDALLRTLETRFERRQSKREDIEVIREYEEQLISKQRENTQIYHQLRLVQMQKENNDKIYTRIFTSSKKSKKSLSHKGEVDIHALFKQSQTTDFRHLLKMSHKS